MFEMVDGTGIIGVDMICPLGVSTPQPPNYDKVEMEGAGILVLPNSLNAPLERLELGGKTEQVQTSGKNLANPSEFVIGTLAGDTGNIINLKQYIATGYIPVIPGKRYSTSCGNKFLVHTITAYDKEKKKINYPMNMSSEMPEGAAYIRLSYKKIDMANVTESDMEELKKVCMVNEGSTVLPYEPYTGGKPSPSPEYPQEIKNVGKWNEEKQKYEVDVKVFAGNLFDGSNSKKGFFAGEFGGQISLITSQGYSWESKIDTLSGVKVTLSVQSNVNTRFRIYATDINGMILYKYEDSSANQADNYHTFVIPDKTENLLVSVLEISDSKDAKIILNVGENRLPNAIYKAPQSLTLTSDRPITKWDKLVEQDRQIGWLYNSVNETIDGKTGKWSIQPASKIFYRTDITFPIAVPFCSELLGYDYSSVGYKKDTGISINNLGILCITLQEEVELTLDAYKQYLADNPLHVLYKDDSEEFVPLPQSEQNAIRALKTYYPTTVITVDGGEVDPDIKVTYRKEI